MRKRQLSISSWPLEWSVSPYFGVGKTQKWRANLVNGYLLPFGSTHVDMYGGNGTGREGFFVCVYVCM